MKIYIECNSLDEYKEYIEFIRKGETIHGDINDSLRGRPKTSLAVVEKAKLDTVQNLVPPTEKRDKSTQETVVNKAAEPEPKESAIAPKQETQPQGLPSPIPTKEEDVVPWVKGLSHEQLLDLVKEYPDIGAAGALLTGGFQTLLCRKVANYFEAKIKQG